MWGQFTPSQWLTPDKGFLLAISAIVVFVLWTFLRRRLRVKPPRRLVIGVCIFLSIGLHILLLLYLPQLPGNGHGGQGAVTSPQPTPLALVDIDTLESGQVESSAETGDDVANIQAPPLPAPSPTLPDPDPEEAHMPQPQAPESIPAETNVTEVAAQAVDQMLSDLLLADATRATKEPELAPAKQPSVIEPLPGMQFLASPNSNDAVAVSATSSPMLPQNMVPQSSASPAQVPQDFANRRGPARLAAVYNNGGDERTEAAVAAALVYLAGMQEPDGRWSAARHGAGREEQVFGHTRNGAGRNADTGVTGLALLAMLGRGVTLQDPQYGNCLSRGLNYLRSIQRPDGSLAGGADTYAAMYSHGIASLAMVEAYAMTRDPALRQVAQAALAYTIRSQHPTTGGWRYFPGDTGDLSQFGWQAMALQTGIWAGLPVPESVTQKMTVFLRTVRSGNYGGLATYRPGERPSASMTAEGLATRLLLGLPVSDAEAREAETLLLAERPGVGRDNLYYWYYASLALHQRGSSAWDQWNQAMKSRVLATQQTDGSWPTDSLWGGYGGSIYTTSVATLCLEVYYRHLAIHRGGTAVATQPGETGSSLR